MLPDPGGGPAGSSLNRASVSWLLRPCKILVTSWPLGRTPECAECCLPAVGSGMAPDRSTHPPGRVAGEEIMRRPLPLSLVLVTLAAAPAFADPAISVNYHDGLLRVTLAGSYAGTYYQVWRSGELVGQYDPLASELTLCTGDCFLVDQEAIPGKTYYYRFDLHAAAGGIVSYGPYAVTVPDTPVGARIWPNPSDGRARIELSVPGSSRRDAPLQAEARLIDLQGRTVRVLFSGPLARGVTPVAWDGRDGAGRQLRAGIYFLRLTTPLGASTTRIVRFR